MKVVVCVKQVPDPDRPWALDPSTHRLDRRGEAILDPADGVGVEAGLQLVEALGGDVTALTMGPDLGLGAVRRALAMGASGGVLVSDPGLAGADALTTARVLAAAIGRLGFDIVITATQSSDGGTGIVPAAVAELLAVPAVTHAVSLDCDGSRLRAVRRMEVEDEHVEVDLPVLVSVIPGLNRPRYPSLGGILSSGDRPLEVLGLAELGLAGGQAGPPQQTVVASSPAPARGPGEIHPDHGDGGRRIADFLASLGFA